MKTLDGHYMNVSYDTIVAPGEIETISGDLLFPSILAAKIDDQAPRHNLGLIIEPRLSAVSKTAWYAFSKMMDTFEYAYLEGEENMYTEVNTNTDVDGLDIKVRHDFGGGLVDSRGMAMATGKA
jgi:hypothetical protein